MKALMHVKSLQVFSSSCFCAKGHWKKAWRRRLKPHSSKSELKAEGLETRKDSRRGFYTRASMAGEVPRKRMTKKGHKKKKKKKRHSHQQGEGDVFTLQHQSPKKTAGDREENDSETLEPEGAAVDHLDYRRRCLLKILTMTLAQYEAEDHGVANDPIIV
eukprot:CAMPEP_0113660044 /NCGR_PEP_ID=MMETSP0017_2-20120614/32683_1 /TAXON_ID=2856 /ORGANISM="Cylindrotheca closterium" /LENGTH=159 /DNA_ID=CAMNT_0000574639 /DNA_START=963 /DNA_END=1442 /DNA_ORIENTATION=+ /assembly_acc=CAM_ASM_000147